MEWMADSDVGIFRFVGVLVLWDQWEESIPLGLAIGETRDRCEQALHGEGSFRPGADIQ